MGQNIHRFTHIHSIRMNKPRTIPEEETLSTINIAHSVMNTLEDKKAEKLVLLDVRETLPYTDYLIIGSGTSDRMLRGLGMAVLEDARNQYKLHGKMEGKPENGWILLDLGDVIVHLFSPEQRHFYQVEDLWKESKTLVTIH